jgi:hypothetical protein
MRTEATQSALSAFADRAGTEATQSALGGFADRAGLVSGFVSGLGLLVIAAIICWEIFSRYVLNAPTTWVTEIATYLLVAVAFLGLAAAQRATRTSTSSSSWTCFRTSCGANCRS